MKELLIFVMSAINPISTGAIAPPTIDIIRYEDACFICSPAPRKDIANIVGNMMLSQR